MLNEEQKSFGVPSEQKLQAFASLQLSAHTISLCGLHFTEEEQSQLIPAGFLPGNSLIKEISTALSSAMLAHLKRALGEGVSLVPIDTSTAKKETLPKTQLGQILQGLTQLTSTKLPLEIGRSLADAHAACERLFQEGRMQSKIPQQLKSKDIKSDITLPLDKQDSLRYQIAAAKYKLTVQECKFLVTATNIKANSLIPDTEANNHGDRSYRQTQKIYTYDEYLAGIKAEITRIQDENSRKSFFSRKKSTKQLEAARDFLTYMQIKHNAVTTPQAYLKLGQHIDSENLGLKTKLETDLSFVKKYNKSNENIVKGVNFKKIFSKAVSGFAFRAPAKALKKLAASYQERTTLLDAQKKKTCTRPAKPINLKKMSKRKSAQAIETWLRDKGDRNTTTTHEFAKHHRFYAPSLLNEIGDTTSLLDKMATYQSNIQKMEELTRIGKLAQIIIQKTNALQDHIINLHEVAAPHLYSKIDASGQLTKKAFEEYPYQFQPPKCIRNSNELDKNYYDELMTSFSELNFLKDIPVNKESLEAYYRLFDIEVAEEEEKFPALLAKIKKLGCEAATLSQEALALEKLFRPNGLMQKREASALAYNAQLIALKNSSYHKFRELNPLAKNAISVLGKHIETNEQQLKIFKDRAQEYYLIMKNERIARLKIDEILKAASAEEHPIAVLEAQFESISGEIYTLRGSTEINREDRAMLLDNLELIAQTIKSIVSDKKDIHEVKSENQLNLIELDSQITWVEPRIPKILAAGEEALEALKYNISHTTKQFGFGSTVE